MERNGLELVALPVKGDEDLLAQVMTGLTEHRWPVSGLHQERGRLDEVFRTITEEADHV